MNLIQTIKEEVAPLSSKQGLILYIAITCVFQFVLFYAPTLNDDAIKEALANEIVSVAVTVPNSNTKNESIVASLAPEKANTNNEVLAASLAPEKANAEKEEVRLTETTDNISLNETIPTATTTAETGPKVIRTSKHVMTAYNSDPRQTDDSPCITANGFNVCDHGVEDTIAANFLKFGTKVMIPDLFGDRVFIVRDRMNKRFPDRVDIWMKNIDDARKFGVKTAQIQVIE